MESLSSGRSDSLDCDECQLLVKKVEVGGHSVSQQWELIYRGVAKYGNSLDGIQNIAITVMSYECQVIFNWH